MSVATELESPQTKRGATGRMKALVYHGPGKRAWEETPTPGDPGRHRRHRPDHDLDHLRHRPPHPQGRPAERDGRPDSRPRGHRRRGGSGRRRDGRSSGRPRARSPVSRPAESATTAGKACTPHCRYGGWILGNTIDGTQAEYVRIPHADTSLYHVPARRRRRSARHAQRHPADRFRVRRVERSGEARRHGGHRGRGPDRPRRPADGAVLFAGRRAHDRSGRQPLARRARVSARRP